MERAIAVYTNLIRIFEGYAPAHYELGKLNEEMGRPEEAAAEYAIFLEMWANADEGLPQLEEARMRLAALK